MLRLLTLGRTAALNVQNNNINFHAAAVAVAAVFKGHQNNKRQERKYLTALEGPLLFSGSGTRQIFTKCQSHVAKSSRPCGKKTMAEQVPHQSVTPPSPTHDRSKCIFCKITDGKESNEIFYQDEEIVVFQDIKPAAKHHLLVVTREHIRDSKSLLPHHLPLLERLLQVGNKVLLEQIKKHSPDTPNPEQVPKQMGFHWPPFHTVSHLHLHVIAPSDQMGFIARSIFRPNSFWFVTPDYIKERLEKMAEAKNSNT